VLLDNVADVAALADFRSRPPADTLLVGWREAELAGSTRRFVSRGKDPSGKPLGAWEHSRPLVLAITRLEVPAALAGVSEGGEGAGERALSSRGSGRTSNSTSTSSPRGTGGKGTKDSKGKGKGKGKGGNSSKSSPRGRGSSADSGSESGTRTDPPRELQCECGVTELPSSAVARAREVAGAAMQEAASDALHDAAVALLKIGGGSAHDGWSDSGDGGAAQQGDGDETLNGNGGGFISDLLEPRSAVGQEAAGRAL